MEHALGAHGLRALGEVLRQPCLLGFDFDGTLAPHVRQPAAARVPPPVARQLHALARLRPVAILTGRDVADVRARLGFAPHYIVGNHGAEHDGSAAGAAMPAGLPVLLQGAQLWLHACAGALQQVGVAVETKRCSIALHLHPRRDAVLAHQTVRQVLGGMGPGLQVWGGPRGYNITVAGAPDKADALQLLLGRSGCACALYAGDDLNDEPVFARAPAHWMTVHVGRGPASRARYFLERQREMGLLLARMLELLAPA